MFAEPIVLTLNAIAYNNYAVNRGNLSSKYQTSDGKILFDISHEITKSRRTRHLVRGTQFKDVVDPYSAPAKTSPQSISCYCVIDVPQTGFTTTEIQDLFSAVRGFPTTSTNFARFLGNES